MDGPVLGRAGLAVALTIWGHAAAAAPATEPALAPPVVRIQALAAESCVSELEVRAALLQAGLRIVAPADADQPGITRIEVAGTPEHLSVQLRATERADSALLPPATCTTATDVVVAFLVSTLAPVPNAPTPQPSPMGAATLTQAVRAELARRGIQLVLERVSLSLERDGSGTWFARVSRSDEPSVAWTLALGNFDELSAPRLDSVTDGIVRMIREVSAREPAPAATPRSQAYRDATVTSWLGAGELVLGSAALLFLAGGHSPNAHFSFGDGADAFMSAGASVAVLGGGASFFVPGDYRRTVVGVSSLAAVGSFVTGMTLAGEPSVPGYSTAALAAGSYSSAALLGLDAALAPPRQSRHALPPWLSYSPLIAGGLVATVPAFADGFTHDMRNSVAAGGAISCAVGLAGALLSSHHARKQDEQDEQGRARASDLAFGVLPGSSYGISLSGRF